MGSGALRSRRRYNLEIPEEKKSKKKRGKIARVFKLHQEGKSVKEIAEKTALSERIVRSYVWRMKNPEKYRSLLKRYYSKKRQKDSEAKTAEKKPVEAVEKEKS